MFYQDGMNKGFYDAIRAYARRRNHRSFLKAFRDIASQMTPRRTSVTPFYNYLHGLTEPDRLDDAFQIGRILNRRPETLWPPRKRVD